MPGKFHKRSFEKELLDQEGIPFKEIEKTMKELHFINTYLGGYSATKEGLKNIIPNGQNKIRIADVGSGGGDTLVYIAEWCRKNDLDAELIGIDIKEECIKYAQENTKGYSNIKYVCSDYRLVEEKFDIIHSCLFTHHLNDTELQDYLFWAKEKSELGIISNDLHRHYLAYYSIKYLTKWFSRSYLVKNDACLSVWRSFKKKEWLRISADLGFKITKVKWKWAFRYSTVLIK